MNDLVLMTDHPWPDISVERSVIEAAGFRFVAGPREAPDAAAVAAMAAEHDPVAIMTCWAQVSAAAIGRPPVLKVVARMGVGLDNIDIAAATARGAWVTNVPDYAVEEVSDHAVALLLDLWRGVTLMDRDVKAGHWSPGAANLRRVANMTAGIVGYGRIGQATARKLQGLGCSVLAYSPSLLERHRSGHRLDARIVVADLQTIKQSADAIVLHMPLTPATRHLVDDDFIGQLARRPVLVNVSRGGLIDNDALVRGLESGRLAGAGLDVIEGEPSPPRSVTARADVIATPHMAFSSDASLHEVCRRSAEDVVRVLRGQAPLHPCNQPAASR